MTFTEKWLTAVDKKNSVLVAGLDPAIYEMDRGDQAIPLGQSKLDWAKTFLPKILPYVAGVKPNIQYWKDRGDMAALEWIADAAHNAGVVVIDDSKLADISDTNDAGFFYSKRRGADAVTVAPFAGNLAEAALQGDKYQHGVISMCLMSNKDYEREKMKLVPIADSEAFDPTDISKINGICYVRQYVQLAADARKFNVDGIVIGAPSTKNHLQQREIKLVRNYVGSEMSVLMPGIGAQEGNEALIFQYFDANLVMVNVGRSMMFPKDGDVAATAKMYQMRFNSFRI